MVSQQREEIFSVFMGTLTDRYEKGGGVRLTKQAAAPAGVPVGK
jgi:peptidyl-prolyl cis-trans isomerase D